MNTLTNDAGQEVYAIGSEGSIMRLFAQYPLLIANLGFLSRHGYNTDKEIEQILVGKGFKGLELETIKEIVLTW